MLHACSRAGCSVNHGCPRLERSLPEALPRGRHDENSRLALRLPGSRCVADLRDGVAARNNVQVGYSLVAVNGKDIKNLTSDTFKLGAEQRTASCVMLSFSEVSGTTEGSLESAACEQMSQLRMCSLRRFQSGTIHVGRWALRPTHPSSTRGGQIAQWNGVACDAQICNRGKRFNWKEKVQTVQKVEKQENAATAIQALARAGHGCFWPLVVTGFHWTFFELFGVSASDRFKVAVPLEKELVWRRHAGLKLERNGYSLLAACAVDGLLRLLTVSLEWLLSVLQIWMQAGLAGMQEANTCRP